MSSIARALLHFFTLLLSVSLASGIACAHYLRAKILIDMKPPRQGCGLAAPPLTVLDFSPQINAAICARVTISNCRSARLQCERTADCGIESVSDAIVFLLNQ